MGPDLGRPSGERAAGVRSVKAARARVAGMALAWALAGCMQEGAVSIPAPDPVSFETSAYPILLADCGFPACHGDRARFFSVFGPGRTRLSAASEPDDPPTPEELALTYARASSMLVGGPPDGSLLLRKPLAIEAGGAPHGGDDAWGRNVYSSPYDPRWDTLYRWALTADEGAAR